MRTLLMAILVGLLSTGCTAGLNMFDISQPDENDAVIEGDVDTRLLPDAVLREEIRTVEEVEFDFAIPDVPAELPPMCEGGCFLDPCEDNGDCLSGWCVEHLGAGVCSQNCQEDCPPGWLCKQVEATGPDLLFVCVSQHANLCKPCNAASDCKTVGGMDDVCIDYGTEGAFCGGECEDNGDCPWGFSCIDAFTVEGAQTAQCVADAGVCPCTGKSIELALSTNCNVTNDFGTCTGKRVCTTEGLTECDAAVPVAEACDGLDNDCDGETDEPSLIGGDYVNLCDDQSDCTEDTCAGEQGCTNTVLDSGSCNDNNPCTIADHCVAGACMGDAVDCDDKNPCTDDSCTEAGGCVHAPNSVMCDDEDPCTLADQCSNGDCAGTQVPCDCQADSDCAPLEDGDLCNGTLVCDLTSLPYKCAVNPATVVTCPAPVGDEVQCLEAVCVPESGACLLAPANEDSLCQSGDACMVSSKCLEGACAGGVPVNCNDGNPCTDDGCSPNIGCTHDLNAAPCSDDDVCTTSDQCQQGGCVGGPLLACDDGDVCNGEESCDSATGCQPGVPLACNDGDPCNGVETCHPTDGCQLSVPPLCDDFNPCTDDSCTADGGCVHGPNTAGCDDGNSCTLGDKCGQGKCLPGVSLACDDENVCTTDYCDPLLGCVFGLNNAPCDDSDLCTYGDACQLGDCVGGGTLPCDDGNPCTDNSCNPQAGCQFIPNDEICDDNNQCTVGDQCANGWCLPGPPLDCDDNNLCTTNSCAPGDGCISTNNTVPCDDANPCTSNDACLDGGCQGGPALNCNDSNPCTDDTCASDSGCVHANNQAGCEDGNACTTQDTCVEGACIPGTGTLQCADENPCTDDGCNPEVGCIFVNNSVACTDDDACTDGDTCVNGACVPGPPKDCPDDGNTCTTHACNPNVGCETTVLPDCCGNGIKEGGEECDDGNQADNDGCNSQCVSDAGGCFDDWMVGLPCSGEIHSGGCIPEETGYHWKGIYNGYACWWNTKNQAWNSAATNPYQLALFFGLNVNTGQVDWCNSFASTPNPPLGGCHGYCDIGETTMWGWCGGEPFTSGGWMCFQSNGKQPCN